jgi:hypothetical protein
VNKSIWRTDSIFEDSGYESSPCCCELGDAGLKAILLWMEAEEARENERV